MVLLVADVWHKFTGQIYCLLHIYDYLIAMLSLVAVFGAVTNCR